ncbi:ribulose-phosphate 3-epimerase [Mycoplasmopsis gallopavonis]|uniref:D-ribulose-5-phosphate 3 epimerase n=1 Tax=Mycoplasmopsis gallopavonis TaxID=76629 RepID=A0A449B0A2_9BACT|nr:ribulose-phosphate 3-epimerase [Mycoplasmopsis gallopavonis]RIV16464.1 ribulose-phosphate 3-epimerase [Mycoplasmopsis gallopavonis]VEU73193.1 d-ribulose-5-phosphate 3 epimerase [Mycoplasmopsis gallopavonis]
MKKYVTPSLLNVEPEKRLAMANTLVENGIKWIHYDIMDGEFVPNTAISVKEIENINKNGLPHIKDAHLMVVDPYNYIPLVSESCDIITFHYEAICDDLEQFESFLEEHYHEFKIGLAIKPETEVSEIVPFLDKLALVLVMSVQPGKGGQKFMPIALEKIQALKNLRVKNGYDFLIQVDGGINSETGPQCFEVGADACVAGTFLVVSPNKETINSVLGKFAK